MTYANIKSEIKKASEQQALDGVACYIAYLIGQDGLISNFMDVTGVSDSQLIKAVSAGYLRADWDVYTVI